MPKLIFLGTSNAIPDETHENTHMVLVGEERLLLIDAVNNPIVRLHQSGLDGLKITDLLVTHFHPDHVSGVPTFLMNSWLLGRKQPLNLYGLDYTLDRVQRLMDDYDWGNWPDFYPVNFHRIPETELFPALQSPDFNVYTSPVRHLVPTIGLRVEFPAQGKVLAYSCDTAPCPEVVRLAGGADVLVHEATGATSGHSSAAQAGQIAQEAEAAALVLIHYRVGGFDAQALVGEALKTYEGPVSLAKDFGEIDFS